MASFFVIRGKDNGQHFAIRGSNASLGRDATNQIQLRDNEVSRKHAKIIRTGETKDILGYSTEKWTFEDDKHTRVQWKTVVQHQ